jgi:integrase
MPHSRPAQHASPRHQRQGHLPDLPEIFRRAASSCTNEETRERLLQASTHWLRHTAASHQLDAGIPLMVSQNLRHASIQTTRRYLHSEDDARHQPPACTACTRPTDNAAPVSPPTTQHREAH